VLGVVGWTPGLVDDVAVVVLVVGRVVAVVAPGAVPPGVVDPAEEVETVVPACPLLVPELPASLVPDGRPVATCRLAG
jgi:hypothetical protein